MLKKLQALVFLLFLVFACSAPEAIEETSIEIDLEDILERGTLNAITGYSPLSYFIYRGEPMGYEYELLKMLTDELGLDLNLIVARDIDEMFDLLNSGEGDVIAYRLTVTGDRREQVAFTRALNTTRQVLVQKKPSDWRSMRLHEIERKLIRSPINLSGETIHVRKGSSYVSRLHNLSQEIGSDIHIVEAGEGTTTEDLIKLVARDSIRFTVSDENIAKVNQSYYPALDIQTAISLPQQTAWAVRNNSPDFLETLNGWITQMQSQTDFYVIYNKYFENPRAYRDRAHSDLLSFQSGRISEFDEIIQKYADSVSLSWKLLSAMIYQESQFDPNARSWTGAQGLMQLMPRTARAFGAANPLNPDQNIQAGVRFIQWLENYWLDFIQDENERIKFVIASYNVGQGHVQDARRLARKYDADPDNWDDVARFLLKKSDKKYYNDEVVYFGYCRGSEPVNYVRNVLYIYNHYKRAAQLYELYREQPELALR